jgi:predicted secreted protein
MSKKKKSIIGKKMMLWVGGKTVALATTLSVDVTAETTDTDNKDEGIWGDIEVSKMSWSVEHGSMHAPSATDDVQHTYCTLYDLMIAGEGVNITVGMPANWNSAGLDELETDWTAPTDCQYGLFTGSALITDCKLQADNGSTGTVSISLKGKGALKRTKAVP